MTTHDSAAQRALATAPARAGSEPGELPPACRSIGGCALAAALANAGGAEPVGPIERDESMDRTYIPIPGGWEVQTKGKGSSFRICNVKTGDRWIVTDERIHKALEQMARDANTATAPARAGSEPGLREALKAHARKTFGILGDSGDVCRWLDAAFDALAATPEQPAQAQPAVEDAEKVPMVEYQLLRAVYEEARRVLRFMGVDNDAVGKALDDMDAAIEQVKDWDGGNYEATKPAVWLTGAQIEAIYRDIWGVAMIDVHHKQFARAIEAALAAAIKAEPEPIERNFCTRCGKRLVDGDVHTCTPPLMGPEHA